MPEDLGRNWPLDLGIVSSEKPFLEALADLIPAPQARQVDRRTGRRAAEIRKKLSGQYELGVKYSKDTGRLHPAVLCKEVHDFFYKGDIDPKQTVIGGGGWTIGVHIGRWQRAYRPGQGIVCPYQYGAIGPDLAMMIGASAAVQRGVGPQAPYQGAPHGLREQRFGRGL